MPGGRPRNEQIGPDGVMQFIEVYIRQMGMPPTIREIGAGTGLASTSAVFYNLAVLRSQGKVKWTPGKARTITVVKE
jgi:repressor LexA